MKFGAGLPPSFEFDETVAERHERGWKYDVLWHDYMHAVWDLTSDVLDAAGRRHLDPSVPREIAEEDTRAHIDEWYDVFGQPLPNKPAPSLYSLAVERRRERGEDDGA